MKTTHEIFIQPAQNLKHIPDNSINLVITSPPYPMIEMWDEIFSNQNENIKEALENKNGNLAFKLMHDELLKVWKECYRVLAPGCIACINIGDATRTVDGNFQLYPSHSKIIQQCIDIGFQALPEIIWRKPTNAPNKFMGSGMLPPSAYVTLEHEFILIFRKGTKRKFENQELNQSRRKSAYFWEERNQWFSDLWEIKGTTQNINNNTDSKRKRSAAFPFELAYRLINMFSIENDTILDPFLGTGTSMFAAMASKRNSIGIEIDSTMLNIINDNIKNLLNFCNKHIEKRILNHVLFIKEKMKRNEHVKYINKHYGFPVITKQEINLKLTTLTKIRKISNSKFETYYKDFEINNNPAIKNLITKSINQQENINLDRWI
ncbi:MAG: DNA-methyltransferase [Promethearchaeota archaeon]